jgi:hypothetical protein
MLPFDTVPQGKISFFRLRRPLLLTVLAALLAVLLASKATLAQGQEAETRPATPSRLLSPIDEHALAPLRGNVRVDLTPDKDLGAVEDGMTLRLYLVLRRSPAQQADLDNLLARQQQRTAAEYHKWLTPKAFGARFGASQEDIAKLSGWLESHGLKVRGVLNNASIIDFEATAGQVRDTFHTQLHYFNIRGGKFAANVEDPQIPAVLAPVVAGIHGLSKIPLVTNYVKARRAVFDAQTHSLLDVRPSAGTQRHEFSDGGPYYFVTPQDFYTIYTVNPVFSGGDLAGTATVAVIEQSDIDYGTVNGTTFAASGGDVATFRTAFGVPGTLNMHVYHGYGTVTCNDPGIVDGDEGEASLDAEWINATAPSANLIFMSCDNTVDNGVISSMAAVIDNNLADVMSMSYGSSELNFVASDYAAQDTLYAQAAMQGQSIFISSGDSGSDDEDQNTTGLATSGINVSGLISPLVTATGGTDFSDYYDANSGGPAESTYWGATNSSYYGDALEYVPETAWNNSCVSSLYANFEGFTGLGLCSDMGTSEADGSVVGGSGGISTHYMAPAYQLGISGYNGTYHSIPDIAGFAANGFWGHVLVYCDSNDGATCASSSEFGLAGGTSFVAPYMAGAAGLLVDYTGSRQGVLNPALYALAKAQYTATATANGCYSSGQTNNIGVTTGLPAASCIFNDITTSNNDMPCAPGSTDCYSGTSSVGALSLDGSSSLAIGYQSTPGFDQVTGIGSVNVNNLITEWNTAFTSTTAISASSTTITTSQSTTLTATVTGGPPEGYIDTPPALTGKVSFSAGTTALGSCTVSAGTCSFAVSGSALEIGANSVTATFAGSPTYPSSSSSILTVTVTVPVPSITSVSAILPQQTQTITITGTGFGSQSAYTADSNYIELTDLNGNWNAGYTGDTVTLAVSSWTDTQIVLGGLSGKYAQHGWCLKPGDSLSVRVWNAQTGSGPAVYPIVASSGTDTCPPAITSVSTILPQQTQTITITGESFGSHPAYTGDSSYLELTDLNGSWNVGHSGDAVFLAVSSWTDTQIVLSGLSGEYGSHGWCIRPGDQLSISVWNANTGGGPAVYPIVAASGTDLCSTTITGVSAILPQQTQTITITGEGFGTQSAYTADSSYIELTDTTAGSWNAGYTGDAVTLAISSWTDKQIVLTGFSGEYGTHGWCISPGDQLSVKVRNAQTGGGPAVYQVVASSGTNTCP